MRSFGSRRAWWCRRLAAMAGLVASALLLGCTLSFDAPTDARSRDAARADAPSVPRDGDTTRDGDAPRDAATSDGASPQPDAGRDGNAAGCDPTRCPASPCEQAFCDADGGCGRTVLAMGTGCSDGDPCTQNDVCDAAGACRGVPCADDGNPCTADSCGPSGCVSTPLADRTTCAGSAGGGTTGSCCSGTCVNLGTNPSHCGACGAMCRADSAGGGMLVCRDGSCRGCTTDSDCLPSGGLPSCLRRLQCIGGVCDPTPGPAACYIDGECWASGDRNPADVCEVCTGRSTEWQTASTCDDGVFCTSPDPCVSGSCRAGPPRDCDDGNPCTDDSCNETADRCDHAPIVGTPCDDGNACTDGDTCVAEGSGAVCHGGAITCPDAPDACQSSTCDPTTGCAIVTDPDGTPCDTGVCMGSVCITGSCSCD